MRVYTIYTSTGIYNHRKHPPTAQPPLPLGFPFGAAEHRHDATQQRLICSCRGAWSSAMGSVNFFPKNMPTPKSLKTQACGSCYELWTHWFVGVNLEPPSIPSQPARPMDRNLRLQKTSWPIRMWAMNFFRLPGHGKSFNGVHQANRKRNVAGATAGNLGLTWKDRGPCRFPLKPIREQSGLMEKASCPLNYGISIPMHINVCHLWLGSFCEGNPIENLLRLSSNLQAFESCSGHPDAHPKYQVLVALTVLVLFVYYWVWVKPWYPIVQINWCLENGYILILT